MHEPEDKTVPLVNAVQIYSQLQHPKPFIALDGANHLLIRRKDAEYVAKMVAVWAGNALEANK